MSCVSCHPAVTVATGACASHALCRRPDWIDNWSALDRPAYEAKKEEVADAITARLERIFPGLKEGTMFRYASSGRKAANLLCCHCLVPLCAARSWLGGHCLGRLGTLHRGTCVPLPV